MKQVIITVENQKQADKVVKVLGRAEENGRLDFAFGCQVKEAIDHEVDVVAALLDFVCAADELTDGQIDPSAGQSEREFIAAHEAARAALEKVQIDHEAAAANLADRVLDLTQERDTALTALREALADLQVASDATNGEYGRTIDAGLAVLAKVQP